MAGNLEAKEDVFFLGAATDIVQHQGYAARGLTVADNAYMGQAAAQVTISPGR